MIEEAMNYIVVINLKKFDYATVYSWNIVNLANFL